MGRFYSAAVRWQPWLLLCFSSTRRQGLAARSPAPPRPRAGSPGTRAAQRSAPGLDHYYYFLRHLSSHGPSFLPTPPSPGGPGGRGAWLYGLGLRGAPGQARPAPTLPSLMPFCGGARTIGPRSGCAVHRSCRKRVPRGVSYFYQQTRKPHMPWTKFQNALRRHCGSLHAAKRPTPLALYRVMIMLTVLMIGRRGMARRGGVHRGGIERTSTCWDQQQRQQRQPDPLLLARATPPSGRRGCSFLCLHPLLHSCECTLMC